MSSEVESLGKTEGVCLPSQEARKIFGGLGISFATASFKDIYRVASRDTGGGVCPYIAGFSEFGKKREDWIFNIGGIEIGFYFTGFSTDQKTGKRIGEVGMVHVAPELRRRGLGRLVYLLGIMELVEKRAEVVRSLVGDDTGAILDINKELGFYDTGERVGVARHPLWILPVSEKGQLLARLSDIFTLRAEKIRPSNLNFDPKDIDIDNPERVPSIKELVNRRLKEKSHSFQEDRALFGYHYAPVFLYQEGLGGSVLLHLQVKENAMGKAISLEEIARLAIPGFCPEINRVFGNREIFEIWSPELKTAKEIEKFALDFAGIGESFYCQCRADGKT